MYFFLKDHIIVLKIKKGKRTKRPTVFHLDILGHNKAYLVSYLLFLILS